jgi:cytochrome c oxidase assembly protein subunit 15
MIDFVLNRTDRSCACPVDIPAPQKQISRFALGMAAETLFLMALGSATRVMNAGLACPDWPLCYGELIPQKQMNFQVFLEWFHRLTASSMGVFAIALAALAWWYRSSLPRWTPWATLLALALVVFQGVLGGLTVTELLRFDIVTAHLGTALLFFITLLAIGILLMPYQGTNRAGTLRWIGLTASILVYLQSILGALVGSQWALHQCLGTSSLCLVMNSHILGVVPPTVATLALVVIAWRTAALHPTLRTLATMAGGLVLLQILLGIATFQLRLQVEPLTISHQAIGAVLLGTLVSFTVLAMRDLIPVIPQPNDDAIALFPDQPAEHPSA